MGIIRCNEVDTTSLCAQMNQATMFLILLCTIHALIVFTSICTIGISSSGGVLIPNPFKLQDPPAPVFSTGC